MVSKFKKINKEKKKKYLVAQQENRLLFVPSLEMLCSKPWDNDLFVLVWILDSHYIQYNTGTYKHHWPTQENLKEE